MKRRELLAMLAAGAMVQAATSDAEEREAHYTQDIALPKPNVAGTITLEQAIERRRSVRAFRAESLPVGTIGQLLWAGQGVTNADGTRRAAPSAGALYALELYAVTAAQVMHYVPAGHRAQTRDAADLRPALKALSLGQASVGEAPLVIAVAADPARLSARYGARAGVYADLEAGHATQNLLLQAVALGLGAVPVGAVDGPRAAQTLALPHGQTVVYLVPVGFAA
ncbi:MAG TPA: SagB/ThcOx family dehydrogenase [Paraburkholderia sp.]|jgi:SagB-type dehydrogenase family enzyme|nr:SagB/ThcOx family dehydrogenase [Paraburkholderia sp.]